MKGRPSASGDRARATTVDLDLATERPYVDLLADIAGHPEGSPIIAELAHTNPDHQEDAIRERLDRLLDEGIVEREASGGYRLADEAREAFDETDVCPEEAWRRQYGRVEE